MKLTSLLQLVNKSKLVKFEICNRLWCFLPCNERTAIKYSVGKLWQSQVCVRQRSRLLFLPFIGLERTLIASDSLFLNIGERCNVAGSRRFARLVREGQYEVCCICEYYIYGWGALEGQRRANPLPKIFHVS